MIPKISVDRPSSSSLSEKQRRWWKIMESHSSHCKGRRQTIGPSVCLNVPGDSNTPRRLSENDSIPLKILVKEYVSSIKSSTYSKTIPILPQALPSDILLTLTPSQL